MTDIEEHTTAGITIYSTTFRAMTYINTELRPVQFKIKLGIDYVDPKPYFQAVAHERIEFMMTDVFNHSVMVSRQDENCEYLYDMMDNQIVECWDEPWDQSIAMMIYQKLNAVLDNKIYITFLSLKCDQAEGLEFVYSGEEMSLEFKVPADVEWAKKQKLERIGLTQCWFYRNDMTTGDYIQELEGGDDGEFKAGDLYIANLDLTWESIGLGWEKPKNLKKKLKKKKKDKNVNNVKQFTPRIVE